MTIPQSFDFSDPEELQKETLFRNLNEMYEKISTGVNGQTRTSAQPVPYRFTPTVEGSSTAGTFTYSKQYAYVHRVGRFVDFWYDIGWSAKGTAAGNLIVRLPYKAALFEGNPFVGTAFQDAINIGSYSSLMAQVTTETFNAVIYGLLTNGAKAAISVPSSGNLQGYIRYLTTEAGGN